MIQRNRGWGLLISAILFMALLCAGCGKKADPRYPDYDYPAKVTDLAVSVDEGKAVLEWGIPGQWERTGYVRIFRSALKTDGGGCPGCPRIYAILEYLRLRDVRSKEGEKFRYVDRNIREGFSYSYRVVICNPSGTCGDQSNTADIEVH